MRHAGALLALLLLVGNAAHAGTAVPIDFRTMPGHARAITAAGQSLTPFMDSEGESRFRILADPDREQSLVLRRPPFDNVALSLRWSPAHGRWRRIDGSVSVDYLQPGQVLRFPRTLRIHAAPSDVRVSRQDTQSQQRRVAAGGEVFQPVPLERLADGRVVVPDAWSPGPLLLEHPLFEPLILRFREGELDAPGDAFPATAARLRPSYGPFSYWQFDVGAAVALSVVSAAWAGWVAPRRRRRRQEEQRRLAVASRVLEVHEAMGSVPLLGETLRTQGGRACVLLQPLGRGATATVYEAVSAEAGDERCAVKVLHAGAWEDAAFRERFEREIAACCGLTHPNVAQILDWGVHDGRLPFIVMERLDGCTLRTLVGGAPIPVERALGWVQDVLKGLRAAHRAGLVHCDVKPGNIWITSSDRAKVLDFGLAGRLGTAACGKGTPAYMAPEQLDASAVTAASDLFSVGVVTYEVLAGEPPFSGDGAWSVLAARRSGVVRPLRSVRPDVPEGVERVVERLLSFDPARRPASADEVLDDLRGRA